MYFNRIRQFKEILKPPNKLDTEVRKSWSGSHRCGTGVRCECAKCVHCVNIHRPVETYIIISFTIILASATHPVMMVCNILTPRRSAWRTRKAQSNNIAGTLERHDSCLFRKCSRTASHWRSFQRLDCQLLRHTCVVRHLKMCTHLAFRIISKWCFCHQFNAEYS